MPNLQAFERTEYQQVKADLHRKILDRLDLEKLGRTPSDAAREEVLLLIRNTVNSEAVPLSFAERERLAREILDEIFGLGPLEPLLKDPTVSDILVNRYNKVYVERAGKLEPTGLSFKDDAHLMQIIDRIVSRVGRRVDESSPMVDARLADGSRVNAIIPPLAIDGPCLSIRRFGRDPVTARNMLENKTLTEPMLELLSAMVKGPAELPDLGWNRRRQDHAAERSFRLHPQFGAHCHHRRRGRTADEAGARGTAGDPSAQHRRQRRGAATATGNQQPPNAPRPHRGGRGPRRRSF